MRPLSPQEVKSLRCRLQQGRHAQSLLRRSTLKSQLSAPSKCTRRPASSASSAGAAIGEFDAALGAAASVEALPALPASRPAECTCNVRRLAERHAVQLKLQRCTTGFNAPASPSPSPPKTASSASAGSGGGHGGAGGSAPSDIAAERLLTDPPTAFDIDEGKQAKRSYRQQGHRRGPKQTAQPTCTGRLAVFCDCITHLHLVERELL